MARIMQSLILQTYMNGPTNESMVSLVSRRYMRGENRKESLMVCLSEYQILCSIYILVIKVCFAKTPQITMFDFQNNVV